MRTRTLVAALSLMTASVLMVTTAAAQDQPTNPRFGKWLLASEAGPPSVNVMTYEAYGEGGMRVTIQAFNSRGNFSQWGYVTNFVSGEFHPVDGRQGSTSAVENVDATTTMISNARNGVVTQVIMNRLTANGDTIHNEYISVNADGEQTGSSTAVYVRIPQGGGRGRGGG